MNGQRQTQKQIERTTGKPEEAWPPTKAGGVSRSWAKHKPPARLAQTQTRRKTSGTNASLLEKDNKTSPPVNIAPIGTESAFPGGNLPLRRLMDDEEEDTSRPTSQLRGTAFGDFKYEERAAQIASRRTAAVVAVPASGSRMRRRVPFHGNAALLLHLPAQFEPLEDRGARRAAAAEEERRRREEDDRLAERPGRRRAALSPETQIGQKLREIGDKFQQDHIDLFLGQQRQNLPVWMRLTVALFGFLFPRPPPVPRLRGEHR
ncbi:uncharacterized protein LOC133468706 [Phyllopteryx taeniolatus]|uniref:uncharacterized protein LOC133468706 n=1 Tax=Phyllopteryx taeniolatus TaxID=161469 RepID=UPI002AD32C4E|nr:uncharacterized protein LOC133468706 [Phyllopteryx taeniolatus]